MKGDESESMDDQVARLERRVENAQSVSGYLEDLITLIHEKERYQSTQETPAESGRYPYVPLGRGDFIRMLMAVKQLYGEAFDEQIDCAHCGVTATRRRTFVDVGCGLADKVVLASKIGFEAHGIEVDPYLIRTARAKYTFHECLAARRVPAKSEDTLTLHPVDAMTFDYAGFDVIYFYRPFSDSTMEAALERRIWRQAKPGAYVLACSADTTPPPALGFRKIEASDGGTFPGSIYVRDGAAGRGKGGHLRSAKKDGASKASAKKAGAKKAGAKKASVKKDGAPKAGAKKRKRAR